MNRNNFLTIISLPKSTHHPTNKKPHCKKYRAQKSPEYGDEITRRTLHPSYSMSSHPKWNDSTWQ